MPQTDIELEELRLSEQKLKEKTDKLEKKFQQKKVKLEELNKRHSLNFGDQKTKSEQKIQKASEKVIIEQKLNEKDFEEGKKDLLEINEEVKRQKELQEAHEEQKNKYLESLKEINKLKQKMEKEKRDIEDYKNQLKLNQTIINEKISNFQQGDEISSNKNNENIKKSNKTTKLIKTKKTTKKLNKNGFYSSEDSSYSSSTHSYTGDSEDASENESHSFEREINSEISFSSNDEISSEEDSLTKINYNSDKNRKHKIEVTTSSSYTESTIYKKSNQKNQPKLRQTKKFQVPTNFQRPPKPEIPEKVNKSTLKLNKCSLIILIGKCKGLRKPKNILGVIKPFIVVVVKNIKKKSSSAEDGSLNPSFKEKFRFGNVNLREDRFILEVRNKVLVQRQRFGVLSKKFSEIFNLEEMEKGKNEITKVLELDGEGNGKVMVKFLAFVEG